MAVDLRPMVAEIVVFAQSFCKGSNMRPRQEQTSAERLTGIGDLLTVEQTENGSSRQMRMCSYANGESINEFLVDHGAPPFFRPCENRSEYRQLFHTRDSVVLLTL
jgi:hypothetical protein